MKCLYLFLIISLSLLCCTLPEQEEISPISEEAVVRIGDTVYATIHDAVEHAGNGDTLVLLKDIEIDRTVEIRGKEITLIPKGNRTILRCPAFRKELFHIAEDGELYLESRSGELIIDGNKEKVKEKISVLEREVIEEIIKRTGIESLIKNEGAFTITGKITLCNNSAPRHNGGAIYNNGQFTMSGGLIQENLSDLEGGGIFNDKDGKVTIDGGELSKNLANPWRSPLCTDYFGGGISNLGLCIIRKGIIRKNFAALAGGGISNQEGGVLIINYCEIYSNKSSTGGGVYNDGDIQIENGEIYNNRGNEGGGIFNNKGRMKLLGGKIYDNENIDLNYLEKSSKNIWIDEKKVRFTSKKNKYCIKITNYSLVFN